MIQDDQDVSPEMIELHIPVVVKVRGTATIRVPYSADQDAIQDAMDDVQYQDLDDVDAVEYIDDDDWKPEWPKHLLRLLPMVGQALSKLAKKNIAVVTCEYTTTNSADRAHQMMEENPEYQGFVYIHGQNIEDLGGRGTCHIGFGHRDDEPEKHAAIGKMVAEAFQEVGEFKVEWDGDPENKVFIERNN